MRWVRLVHLYAGLVLSALLLLLAFTGGALVYKEAWWRLVYAELRGTDVVLGPQDHAAAIAAAHARFGAALRSVKLPEPGVPAYHLYLEDGEALLSVDGYGVIDRWNASERLTGLLFDLHAHLLSGETGERVAGFVALGGVLMAVTGLLLWWPTRRRFALVNLWPPGASRGRLLRWHRDLGVVTSPLSLLLLLTGAGLVFHGTTQALLNGLFGDPVPGLSRPTRPASPLPRLPDAATFARVGAAFPEARIVFYYPERIPDSVAAFRLKQGCELHPNGRSYVHVDPAGAIIATQDACAMPTGERITHLLYPLHSGKTGGALYKAVTFAGALALAALAVTGVITYALKLRNPAPVSRKSSTEMESIGSTRGHSRSM